MKKQNLMSKKEMDEYFRYAIRYSEGDLNLKNKIMNFAAKTRNPEEYRPIEKYAELKGMKIFITKEILINVLNSYLEGEIDEEDLYYYGKSLFHSKLMISREYDERYEDEIAEVIMRFEQIDYDGFDRKEAQRLLKILS